MRKDGRTRETILWYRHTFEKDNQSRWTLARWLESGGLFKVIENEQQMAAHNYIVTMMENMGFTQGLNYDKLVDLIFQSLPIPDEAIDR